jgi:hypothetical protein
LTQCQLNLHNLLNPSFPLLFIFFQLELVAAAAASWVCHALPSPPSRHCLTEGRASSLTPTASLTVVAGKRLKTIHKSYNLDPSIYKPDVLERNHSCIFDGNQNNELILPLFTNFCRHCLFEFYLTIGLIKKYHIFC